MQQRAREEVVIVLWVRSLEPRDRWTPIEDWSESLTGNTTLTQTISRDSLYGGETRLDTWLRWLSRWLF